MIYYYVIINVISPGMSGRYLYTDDLMLLGRATIQPASRSLTGSSKDPTDSPDVAAKTG